MKEIELTQGKVALVDDADFEHLNQWKYYARRGRYTWYAVRNAGKGEGRTTVQMHREIMNAPDGVDVDHRDGDGLNNQRYNLRKCTQSQNTANGRKRRDNTTRYKGVSINGIGWMARVMKDGKRVFCKTFPTEEEAARARDEAAKKYHGEFANLNFPE